MDIKARDHAYRSHLIEQSFAEAFSGARHDIPLQRNVPPMPVIPRKCGKIQMMINAAYQQGKAEGRTESIDECKDALLMAITESYIWSEVCEAVKDKEIQLHTDNIYDDFEETIKIVLGKLKEKKSDNNND